MEYPAITTGIIDVFRLTKQRQTSYNGTTVAGRTVLPKKDGATALSGAGSLDTATITRAKRKGQKLIIES